MINPIVLVLLCRNPLARKFGRYSSSSTTFKTRSRISGFTGRLLLTTRETVAIETSALRATSRIVVILFFSTVLLKSMNRYSHALHIPFHLFLLGIPMGCVCKGEHSPGEDILR